MGGGSKGFNPADIAELRDSKQELILKVQSMKKARDWVAGWMGRRHGAHRAVALLERTH